MIAASGDDDKINISRVFLLITQFNHFLFESSRIWAQEFSAACEVFGVSSTMPNHSMERVIDHTLLSQALSSTHRWIWHSAYRLL